MKIWRAVLFVFLIAACLTVSAGCGDDDDNGGEVRVAASIYPLADVVRQIGGQQVQVACLLDPGTSPHDFRATPEHVGRMAGADLLVTAGTGVDEWALQGASRSNAKVLKLADVAESHAATAGDDDETHQHDKHLWLDLDVMQEFARRVGRHLAELDPDNAELYRERAENYAGRLAELDAEYRRTISTFEKRHFVTFHDAFGRLASRYGLTHYSLHDADVMDFSPERLEKLEQFVRDHQVKAMFVEPQYQDSRLRAMAADMNIELGTLDPLGNPRMEAYETYIKTMETNLRSLEEALKE